MYEPTTSTRNRDAFRNAHQERAEAFKRFFRVFR